MKLASLVLACWSWAFCVAFSGCGDAELPDVNNEFAEVNFIGSHPPSGATVPTVLLHVKLIFDGTPRSVTVNGVQARVENTIAVLEFQDWLDKVARPFAGDISLNVEWLNRDGSEGKGAIIHYTLALVSFETARIVDSTVHPGDTVNPDRINSVGITITFSTEVRPGAIEIRPEGGTPLNWYVWWRSCHVTIKPRNDGDKLLRGKDYVIQSTGVKTDLQNVIEPAIENFDFKIHFSTKE